MSLRTNILWTGREFYSLENCLIESAATGSQINSTIVGCYHGKIYKVVYRINTNQNWETVFLEISFQINGKIQVLKFQGDGKGNWIRDGRIDSEFRGCIDVDIPLTPFTNTLPIRRLGLKQGQAREIRVLYFDLLAQKIKVVRQRYTCLSDSHYHYENIPNDFEATIEVDESGLVVDYPSLFVRTSAVSVTYP